MASLLQTYGNLQHPANTVPGRCYWQPISIVIECKNFEQLKSGLIVHGLKAHAEHHNACEWGQAARETDADLVMLQ